MPSSATECPTLCTTALSLGSAVVACAGAPVQAGCDEPRSTDTESAEAERTESRNRRALKPPRPQTTAPSNHRQLKTPRARTTESRNPRSQSTHPSATDPSKHRSPNRRRPMTPKPCVTTRWTGTVPEPPQPRTTDPETTDSRNHRVLKPANRSTKRHKVCCTRAPESDGPWVRRARVCGTRRTRP